MKIDYLYCIKDFKGFGYNFTFGKIYQAKFYIQYDKNYILLYDDDNKEVDFLKTSMFGKELIPQYLIYLKEARKLKLEKIYETETENR